MNTSVLPTHAGPVELEFSETLALPERPLETTQRQRIRLPKHEEMQFHRLKGGQQFLVRYPQNQNLAVNRFNSEPRTFFGGMDESPFITAIKDEAWNAHKEGGEEAFYDALIPETIKKLSQMFPNAPVRRQGDIWSIPLPISWEELQPKWKARKPSRKRKFSTHRQWTMTVLGTNHLLHGKYFSTEQLLIGGKIFSRIALAEGTITAADHKPQAWTGSPHVLARTPHLEPLTDLSLRLRGWE